MSRKKCLSRKEYIKEYILPYEDDKTARDYYEGNIDYDDDYIKEHAKHKRVCVKLR